MCEAARDHDAQQVGAVTVNGTVIMRTESSTAQDLCHSVMGPAGLLHAFMWPESGRV